jgi:ATP-dependent exoDNAse (exonuclease V) beta subunit
MTQDRQVTPDRRVASDAAARERAIESDGSVLVQAPAGSGKTTLLAQRYLRLLALVDAPERVLALTFTRRAAEEMRERVLLALGAAHLPICPPGMNRETWRLAVAASRHLHALHLDIQRQPSRLRIETIDAFNAWLAAQLPISAGAGAGLQVLADARPCYEEAARRALAREEADQFGAAVDRVLALDDQRWRRLLKLISEMLPSRDRWLPLLAGRLQAASALDEAQLLRVRQHLDEDLALLVARVLNRAHEVIGEERLAVLSRLIQGAARRAGADRPDLSAWLDDAMPLRADTADLARWRGVACLLLTAEGEFRKRLTKKEGFPPQCADKPPMQDLLQELDRDPQSRQILVEIRDLPAPLYGDEQWGRVREVAQVLVLAAAELDQVFREQGAADFPAVSLAALRALGSAAAPTDLSLRLDYRLQHILLDEFQDTSSAQLELVALLTAGWQQGDGRSIFCVGDPMQSIYGFRQAEVRAFLELAEDGIGEVRFEVQRLRDNFRSAAPLVDWINSSFARVLPRADDRGRGAIAFRSSMAAIGESPESAAPAVALRGFATRAEESAHIAATIAAQLEQHPAWRVAILVRARTHAREIAAALRARGIAFRAVDIEPLQDRAIVRDIVMLIGALLHLGDRTAWLALLRAPWAGVSLADLLLIARGAPLVWDALADDTVLQQLSEDGRARCRRLRSTLEAAFRVRNDTSIARWVERTWLGMGGASCAASSEDLDLAGSAFARLREMEQRGLPDPADLPAAFADLYADHGAAAAVEIMTIHKSKGLEFDMVVLPALDRHIPRSRDQLLVWHEFARTGRDGMVMAARPAIGADGDRLFEFLRRQLRDAAELEAERLLYVACTRAKWQLRLTARIGRAEDHQNSARSAAEGPAEDSTVAGAAHRSWSPRVGSLLRVLWPVVGPDFAETETEGRAGIQGEGMGAPRGGPLWRVPRDWTPSLGAAPLTTESMSAPPTLREDSPVFDWAGETARRVGTLVHAELQAMDLASSDEAAIRARHPHFHRWLALHGVPADRLQEAAARVVEALTAVHRDPRGRWILQRSLEDVREHALSGPAQDGSRSRGEVVRVVFDRSFIDAQGIRWVIDYKTSQHSGGNLEEFLDREVERYRPQLQRYGMLAKRMGPEPVRLGLYFPLMRAWREWEA